LPSHPLIQDDALSAAAAETDAMTASSSSPSKRHSSKDDYDEVIRMSAETSMNRKQVFAAIAARTGRTSSSVSKNYYKQCEKRENGNVDAKVCSPPHCCASPCNVPARHVFAFD
jgi:hypothetical protein